MAFAQEDAWDDLAREEGHLDHRNYHAVMLAYGKALRAMVPSLPPLEFAQWVAIYLARRWVVQPWSIPCRPNARGEIWDDYLQAISDAMVYSAIRKLRTDTRAKNLRAHLRIKLFIGLLHDVIFTTDMAHRHTSPVADLVLTAFMTLNSAFEICLHPGSKKSRPQLGLLPPGEGRHLAEPRTRNPSAWSRKVGELLQRQRRALGAAIISEPGWTDLYYRTSPSV